MHRPITRAQNIDSVLNDISRYLRDLLVCDTRKFWWCQICVFATRAKKIMARTLHPWRTSFCAHRNDGPIDQPCDALTVKWLTKTHIWVSVVTNLLLPWRYYASSIYGSTWCIHDAPFPGIKRCVLQMTVCISYCFCLLAWLACPGKEMNS